MAALAGSPVRFHLAKSQELRAFSLISEKRTESLCLSAGATESGLCGFSAQSGEIARAYGFICVMGGTGENHIPAVRAQTRPKSLLASEAVPSMRDDDAIDSRTDLAEM
jgi:hypothetical protein